MAWNGYFTLDGQEVINAARTEAYAEAAGAWWLKPAFENDDLAPMLEHAPYTTPLLDNAPWVDPDVPESYDFFGFYPLDVTGIEDSSRSSSVVEFTVDGGSPGRLRLGTKAVVFNGVLVGSTEKAVVYGMTWLRRVLLGNQCDTTTNTDHGFGTSLEYLSAEPRMDDTVSTSPSATLAPLRRTLRKFSVNVGPSLTAQRVIESCGGAVWTVTFSGVAGIPYQFGAERPLLQGYLDPVVTDPWVSGITPGTHETAGTPWTEVECGEDTWEPIYDPLCPALVVPPAPPSVPLGCFDLPEGPPITVTNLSSNPSVEVNATHWSVVAPWTGARTASATADKGDYVYRSTVGSAITSTNQFALQVHNGTPIPASVGQVCGFRIRARVGTGLSRSVQLRVQSHPGGASSGFGVANVTITDEWQEFVVSGVLPADRTGYSLIASPSVIGEWATGNWIEWDGLQPWLDVDPGPDSYFDGDTADDETYTYSWTGTAHASTSEALTFGPGWDRRLVVIPATSVPLWETMAPVVTLYAPDAIRNVRLRFYADPDEALDPNAAACSFTNDLVVSYIPAGGTMTIDAASQEVWVQTVNGQTRRSDSLVFTTNGKPFEWPLLSCGYQHLLTVDTPIGSDPPYIDLSFIPRAA